MIEHPQAEILRALADGNKQFQWCETKGTSAWTDIDSAYVLSYLGKSAYRVRVKPNTVTINGVECPKPNKGSGRFDLIVQLYGAGTQRVLTFASEADARQVFDALVLPFKEVRHEQSM